VREEREGGREGGREAPEDVQDSVQKLHDQERRDFG